MRIHPRLPSSPNKRWKPQPIPDSQQNAAIEELSNVGASSLSQHNLVEQPKLGVIRQIETIPIIRPVQPSRQLGNANGHSLGFSPTNGWLARSPPTRGARFNRLSTHTVRLSAHRPERSHCGRSPDRPETNGFAVLRRRRPHQKLPSEQSRRTGDANGEPPRFQPRPKSRSNAPRVRAPPALGPCPPRQRHRIRESRAASQPTRQAQYPLAPRSTGERADMSAVSDGVAFELVAKLVEPPKSVHDPQDRCATDRAFHAGHADIGAAGDGIDLFG
jgi:hypothetical protein